MELSQILFWILSAVAILFAVGLISTKSPVNSILYLIVVFFAISGQYILLNAQFLAVVNIIVYAGAIMVLFLFVVMLMNLNAETEPPRKLIKSIMGIIAGGTFLIVLLASVKDAVALKNSVNFEDKSDIGLIKPLGQMLFKKYVVPFEVSSILFLAAMMGAVILGKKPQQNKEQNIQLN